MRIDTWKDETVKMAKMTTKPIKMTTWIQGTRTMVGDGSIPRIQWFERLRSTKCSRPRLICCSTSVFDVEASRVTVFGIEAKRAANGISIQSQMRGDTELS